MCADSPLQISVGSCIIIPSAMKVHLASLIIITGASILVFMYYIPISTESTPQYCKNIDISEITCNKSSMSIDVRRRLAATLADVHREIRRSEGKELVIDAKWFLKLASVIEELDPRVTLSPKSSWDQSALLPNMSAESKLMIGNRHVCPEVYAKVNSPYGQEGMKPLECTGMPAFSTVLTAVIPAVTWTPEEVDFVVRQIRKHYDIPIIAIVPSGEMIGKDISSLIIEQVSKGEYENEGLFMNSLFKRIRTPYVFMATSLAHFNNQSSLERLVRVLDELEHVKVAGGAARDLEGNWIHGCLQQRMANYEARYTMGYFYSKYECMYCDDLLTPFVTSVSLTNKVPFTNGLNGSALYRDWFVNIRLNGLLTVTCPDVMFYVRNHTVMKKEQWLTVAKQWFLEKIVSYDGHQYNFDCRSVGITCSNPLGIIKSYLLPPCCRKMMTKYLGYLMDYGKEHGLVYELRFGSIVGAMKMGSYLPWDFDHDLNFKCKDFSAWMRANKVLKPKGCKAEVSEKNKYITVFCKNFFLELYCAGKYVTSRQFLPLEYRHIPTKIEYSGMNVVVSSNPGLYSRNTYGLDVLKHISHWRTLKDKDNSLYLWNTCHNPKNHSCLDKYPKDGNIPIEYPFLHP